MLTGAKGQQRYAAAPGQLLVSSAVLGKALMLILEHDRVCKNQSGGHNWAGSISVEHVLPRNINGKHADWRANGWDENNHALWLHRLGNLALLNDSDNSSLGNLGFQKKRSCIEDLQSTHGLSWSIQDVYTNHKKWTELDVKSRHARLLQIFQNRWALPQRDKPAASDGPAGAVLKCHLPSFE